MNFLKKTNSDKFQPNFKVGRSGKGSNGFTSYLNAHIFSYRVLFMFHADVWLSSEGLEIEDWT